MIADVRREEIYELLKKHRAVTTLALAESFGVSIETIRKDFMAMENAGKLVRVHGGAMIKSTTTPYKKLSKRMESMQTEKAEIAQLAVKFVDNGDVIAIDTGSTAVEFVTALMEHFDTLTIITHSVDVFQRACNYKNFNIILCGGYYLKEENSFYGDFAEEMLNNFHVSKSFIFPAALSLQYGICDCQQHLAGIQRKLISMGDEVIILADSSKFEKSALIRVAEMKTNYKYITDSQISDEIKEIYVRNDIDIITK